MSKGIKRHMIIQCNDRVVADKKKDQENNKLSSKILMEILACGPSNSECSENIASSNVASRKGYLKVIPL